MKIFTTLKSFVRLLVCLFFWSITTQAQPAELEYPRRFQRMQQTPRQADVPSERQNVTASERPDNRSDGRRVNRSGDRKDSSETSEENRYSGRLTPEERRQLRNDIRDHGREVYKDRGTRRP